MAENVEIRAEKLVPQLELMEKLQLFDKNEIRTIMKRRKEFEYKLQRQQKCIKDALQYIQYEMDLMKLVRQKKKEKGLNKKKNNLDYSLANNIKDLFKFSMRWFPDEVIIWLSYIKFCKQVRDLTSASQILVPMLKCHADKPSLFKLAAKWELEECLCVEKARKFLLDGLRVHKDSKLLYAEVFKLELNYYSSKKKEIIGMKNEKDSSLTTMMNDPVLQGKSARAIYDSAVNKINDVSFVIELLQLAKDYEYTEELQREILEDLVNKFPLEELTWDTLAKRELESSSNSSDPNSKLSPKERIKNYTSVYESAVRKLNTQRMWTMYLDRMLELNEDVSTLPNLKRNCLTKAFLEAHNAGMMTEKYYLLWVDHIQGPDKCKRLYDVLRGGTEKLRGSVALWRARLDYHLTRREEEAGSKVFKEAVEGLSEAALPLWKDMLKHYQATSPNKVDELFKEGIKTNCSTVCNPLKIMYLEWLALSRGIKAARKLYAAVASVPPYSLDLHKKMLDLEVMQPEPSQVHIRKCHTCATDCFGHQNTEVWINWIKFELANGDTKNVVEIYTKALRILKRCELDKIFLSEFNLTCLESLKFPQIELDPVERMDVS